MNMLTKRRVLIGKIEGTEGTAETLQASDGGILAISPKIEVDIAMNKREPVWASLSTFNDVPGGRKGKLTFQAEMKGPGASYSSTVVPALGKYLRACGFAETVAVGTSVTYAPASTGIPCLTMALYEDGVIKKLAGCRGSVKFSGQTGGIVMADFSFDGVWQGITDGSLVVPTYEATVPPVLLSAAMAIQGIAGLPIAKFDIDMGCQVVLRDDMNSAAGYKSAAITGRDPRGSFDPEMALVATHDFYGKWAGGSTGALTIGAVGSTTYNKFTITAPKAGYTKVADGERNGIAVADTSFQLAATNGDDEISIAFT
jgi:hypothetical protein